MKVETYQVDRRDLNEEPTKLGAEDGLVQRFLNTAPVSSWKGREEYDNDQDYYDDPQSDFVDPYLEKVYQPIKLSTEDFQRFIEDCIFDPPRPPTQKMLRAMRQARELGIE